MPTINWDTVVTSGATAVFVTLAIEYLVKPRMEARKERYFGILRARQELMTVITKLTLAAKMYGEDLPATSGLISNGRGTPNATGSTKCCRASPGR